MLHRANQLIQSLLIAGVAILPAASPATADVTTAYWTNYQNWGYRIQHMPDFDQRREVGVTAVGLPGDGGMYCVPTASLNTCAYAANHGFSYVLPGPAWWQSQTRYNDATVAIFNMGADMNTHPTDGTGGDWHPGFQTWLQDSATNAGTSEKLTVTAYFITNSFTPSLDQLAHTAVDGSLVTLVYGRYNISGTLFGLPRLVSRSGGHAITLAETFGAGPSFMTLGVRDPADDPDSGVDPLYKQSQSTFTTKFYNTVEHLPVYFDMWGVGQRIMGALNYDDTTNKVALVDGYVGLKPKSGYSFTTGVGGSFQLLMYHPFKFLGDLSPAERVFDLPDGPTINDVAVHPDLGGYYILRAADPGGGLPPALQYVDGVTEEVTAVTDMGGATKFDVSRHRNIYYVTDDGQICCLDGQTGAITGCDSVGGSADDVHYDDREDKVGVLSASEHVLLLYEPGLPVGAGPDIFPIPGSVPLGGNVSLVSSTAPDDNMPTPWSFVTDASDSVFVLTMPGPLAGGVQVTEIAYDEIQNPTCVSFDDAGRMYVAAEGTVHELLFDTDLQEWMLVPEEDQEFGGFAIGECFYVTRSRTNANSIHDEWTNIDPESGEIEGGELFADCLADFNDDRTVGIVDLLQLLADWGPCELCESDTNEDRRTDIVDLLYLLAEWGDCE